MGNVSGWPIVTDSVVKFIGGDQLGSGILGVIHAEMDKDELRDSVLYYLVNRKILNVKCNQNICIAFDGQGGKIELYTQDPELLTPYQN